MQPSLALVYGSRTGNGHLGVGWQLQGLSEINRCAKTFATEGYADGVNFDADDVFCLDGRKLVAVSGSYGADGTEYRTEKDTFARITLYRSPQHQIASFEVRTKDGRIRTYAPPEPFASYVTSGGKPRQAISWPLQKEQDRSGNSIVVTYGRQGALDAYPLLHGGDFLKYYPERIDYTLGAEESPGTGPRSVRFAYETRPDTSVAYLHGVAFKTTLRLKSQPFQGHQSRPGLKRVVQVPIKAAQPDRPGLKPRAPQYEVPFGDCLSFPLPGAARTLVRRCGGLCMWSPGF